MSAIKDRLLLKLVELPNALLKNRNGDNFGSILAELYCWQETAKYAKEQLENAWEAAVARHVIDDDNVLRKGVIGEESILAESKCFSVIAKLDKPRSIFSKDRFIAAVAKRYKLDPFQLETLAETCVTESRPPLTKRVLEV